MPGVCPVLSNAPDRDGWETEKEVGSRWAREREKSLCNLSRHEDQHLFIFQKIDGIIVLHETLASEQTIVHTIDKLNINKSLYLDNPTSGPSPRALQGSGECLGEGWPRMMSLVMASRC